jgi:hypothetical protein
MTRMAWPALRLAVAELQAVLRMRAEHAQAQRDAALVRALARRRVTRRPSTWPASERAVWRQHEALQRSLKALASEAPVQHVGRAIDCPACQPRRGV